MSHTHEQYCHPSWCSVDVYQPMPPPLTKFSATISKETVTVIYCLIFLLACLVCSVIISAFV